MMFNPAFSKRASGSASRASALFIAALTAFAVNTSNSQTTTSWNSTSSGTWSTAANWTANAPSTGPQIADYPGTATLQHTLDLAGATGRTSFGQQFDFVAGGIGYTFGGTAGAVSGFFTRAGGPINGGAGGIVNNDDNTQTFNVPMKLTSNSGVAGAGAAQTWNAAAGNLVFNGNNNAPATPWTVNLNGASALTIDGSFNTTIGSSGPGQIVNTNGAPTGIIKNGTGTLTLAGTAANTFTGVNRINNGKILAGKVNALGSGNNLILGGGTFDTGGLNEALGTLDLQGSATIDFNTGASAVNFANSSGVAWGSFTLSLLNWTSGSDTLQVGADATGLTAAQLSEIVFSDLPGAPGAQIDANGFITPALVPEPSALAVCLVGGFGLAARLIVRRRKA